MEVVKMELKHPYLKEQIFVYIGNKRRLLGLIYKDISEIYDANTPSGLRFLDSFAGSGVVSRLAKLLNFEVHSNDWEEYSFITNSAYLSIYKPDILELLSTECSASS